MKSKVTLNPNPIKRGTIVTSGDGFEIFSLLIKN